ncbi:MAG: STAS domain-containing protein [Gammaproteobacteria bacterium]|nr:STAS domain-containing protein [Gammaproteobacteria bacterium]
MSTLSFDPAAGGGFAVAGHLGFDTVHGIWETSRAAVAGAANPQVDLGGVTDVDSAGLALVIEWAGVAQAAGRRLEILNPPRKLLDLARISEVEALLAAGIGAGVQDSGSSSKSSSG